MTSLIPSDAIWSKLGKTEAGRRRLHQEQQQRDDKKRADAKGVEEDFIDLAIPLVQASADRIEAFAIQLDRYDAATVAALNQNALELERVQDRIHQMLLQAHNLEDGRRVFRTEDGTRVFDEFGVEIAPDIITPDEIDPRLPTWEDMLVELGSRDRLLGERQDLLSFQERLDDARNEVADGEIGADELEELSDELEDLMPAPVQAELGIEPAQLPALEGDFVRATVPAAGGPNLNLPELNL
jgi:hypothetical protein